MKNKNRFIIAIIAAVVLAAVVGFIVYSSGSTGRELKALLDLGHKYLTELKYEEAVATFKEALSMDPGSEEAKEALVRAYIAWSDQLVADGNMDRAIEVLAEGYELLKDQRILDKKNELVQKRIDADSTGDNSGNSEDGVPGELDEKFHAMYDAIMEYVGYDVSGRSFEDWDYGSFISYIKTNGVSESTGNGSSNVSYVLPEGSGETANNEENALIWYSSDNSYFQMQGDWHRTVYHHGDQISSMFPVLGTRIEEFFSEFGITMDEISKVAEPGPSTSSKGIWHINILYYEDSDMYLVMVNEKGRNIQIRSESGIIRSLSLEKPRQ